MIHHTVQFRFRSDVSNEQRNAAKAEFKAGIEALPAVIPTIRKVAVGFNVNPAEHWDICLYACFDTLEDAKAYGAHPAHRAVALELMKHIEERACTECAA